MVKAFSAVSLRNFAAVIVFGIILLSDCEVFASRLVVDVEHPLVLGVCGRAAECDGFWEVFRFGLDGCARETVELVSLNRCWEVSYK